MPRTRRTPKNILKWAGGKATLADRILSALDNLEGCSTYCEPFLGGGAVLFRAAERGLLPQRLIIGDANRRLIACYQAISRDPAEVYSSLTALPSDRTEYEGLRDAFNGNFFGTEADRAALFIWINRAGFNGMYRENADGKFNVPIGSGSFLLPDAEALRRAAAVLQRCEIHCGDFEQTLSEAGTAGVAVYCDPPYAPISETSSFTGYVAGGFGDAAQQRLANRLTAAVLSGVRVVTSNADVPAVTSWYKDPPWRFEGVQARRSISAKAGSRGSVGELLLVGSSLGPLTAGDTMTKHSVEPSPEPEVPPMPPVTSEEAGFPYVAELTLANVKGLNASSIVWPLALGPRTLIIGPNASEKSAVVNAVEFALTGVVSDVVGRILVADPLVLGTLAPQGEPLVAQVKLASGETCNATADIGSSGYKKPKLSAARPDAFPLRAVREALAGSSDTVRKFLLGLVASSITDADVMARLSENAKTAYWALRKRDTRAATDLLLFLVTESKRNAKAAADEAKLLTAQTSGAIATPPLEADVEAARLDYERLVAARAVGKVGERAEGLQERAAAAVDNWKARKVEAETAAAIFDATEQVIQSDEDLRALSQRRDRVIALRTMIAWHADRLTRNRDDCVLCGSTAVIDEDSLREADETFAEALSDIDRQVRAPEAFRKARVYAKQAQDVADAAKAAAQRAIAAADAATDLERSTVTDVDVITAQVRYRDLSTAAERFADVQTQRELLAERKGDAERHAAIHESATEAVGTLLAGAVDAFVAGVQRYLPESLPFGLVLQSGEREVCRLGFWRGEGAARQLHTALSGAEWASLCSALALGSVVEGNGLRVVVPEERAFDPYTLRDVLDAFGSARAQVIVTSPIAPAGVLVGDDGMIAADALPGWTIVQTGPVVPSAIVVVDPAVTQFTDRPLAYVAQGPEMRNPLHSPESWESIGEHPEDELSQDEMLPDLGDH